MKSASLPQESAEEYGYLDLLARVKKALETAKEISIPNFDIRPYLDQPREHFDAQSIRRLSGSIDTGGQTSSGMIREKPADIRYEVVDTGNSIEPRKVPGSTKYELIDGERRWRSIGIIPETRRPLYRANLIVADDDVIQYLISGITNFNREGHTALETMKTIDRHIDFGFPMKEIAVLLGISEHWARQIHGLKNLDEKVQKLLDPSLPKMEQLPVSAAIQIAKIEKKHQSGLADRVISKDVSLGRLRGEVVKVARKEGSQIRVREVPADQQWNSFGNKLDMIMRICADAEAMIGQKVLHRFVHAQPSQVSALLKKTQDSKDSLAAIESKIRSIRSGNKS